MTCVNRLNYNYYYLAFDVVHESNYKMLGGKRRKRRYVRDAGSLSFHSCKIKFMLGGGARVSSRQCLMYYSK